MLKIVKIYQHSHLATIMILLITFSLQNAAASDARLYFTVDEIAQWQHKTFKGDTHYSVTDVNNKKAIVANSAASASALINKTTIDLDATPYLNWTWQAEQLPNTTAYDNSKDGDDYAARVYVVFKTGGLFFNTASLSYVWANKLQQGQYWPNAYTSKVTIFAIESGSNHRGQWRSYKRNVAEDIKRYTANEVSSLEAIAIMTDSDNSKTHAKAYYRDVWFSAE